jgi:hypothetical protein
MSDPELETAKRVDLSKGGAQEAQTTFNDDVTHPWHTPIKNRETMIASTL